MNLDSTTVSIEREETGLVLVVDDNPFGRALVVALVEHLGYATASVANGRDAVSVVKSRSFSLVLMDIEMPIMDGFRAITRIREQEQDGRHLPVIAMTGHAAEDFKECALAAGFDDLLVKPFEIGRLREVISGQIRRRKS